MKKIMKVILITAVILAVLGAGLFLYIRSRFPTAGDTEITEGYYKKFKSNGELEMKYSQLGEYEVSYTEIVSENESIRKIRFWYQNSWSPMRNSILPSWSSMPAERPPLPMNLSLKDSPHGALSL